MGGWWKPAPSGAGVRTRVVAGAVSPGGAVEEIKAYLRVETAAEDALIARLAAVAIAHGEWFTGQVLLARAHQESMAVEPGWRRLARSPVNAITGVAAATGAAAPVALPVGSHAIDIDAAGDGWVRLIEPGEATRMVVSYTAGLASEWSGLPEAIRHGAVRLAAHLYTHRDAADEPPPPAAVAALWRPWRRMRLS